jgi:hypothetical protein
VVDDTEVQVFSIRSDRRDHMGERRYDI